MKSRPEAGVARPSPMSRLLVLRIVLLLIIVGDQGSTLAKGGGGGGGGGSSSTSSNNKRLFCQMCSNQDEGWWGDSIIRHDGTTCAQIALEMADQFDEGSTNCNVAQGSWRKTCCGRIKPKDMEVFPTAAPVTSGRGQYGPICNLCPEGNKPLNEKQVINLLEVTGGSIFGQGPTTSTADTCINYYDAGQRGQIPWHLCDPLQYFAYYPCACQPKPQQNLERPVVPNPTTPTSSSPMPRRKVPEQSKESLKLSQSYGGAGGGFHRTGRQRQLTLATANGNSAAVGALTGGKGGSTRRFSRLKGV